MSVEKLGLAVFILENVVEGISHITFRPVMSSIRPVQGSGHRLSTFALHVGLLYKPKVGFLNTL